MFDTIYRVKFRIENMIKDVIEELLETSCGTPPAVAVLYLFVACHLYAGHWADFARNTRHL